MAAIQINYLPIYVDTRAANRNVVASDLHADFLTSFKDDPARSEIAFSGDNLRVMAVEVFGYIPVNCVADLLVDLGSQLIRDVKVFVVPDALPLIVEYQHLHVLFAMNAD